MMVKPRVKPMGNVRGNRLERRNRYDHCTGKRFIATTSFVGGLVNHPVIAYDLVSNLRGGDANSSCGRVMRATRSCPRYAGIPGSLYLSLNRTRKKSRAQQRRRNLPRARGLIWLRP